MVYILSLEEKTLIRQSDGFNLFTPPPGSEKYVCEVDYSDREILLDDDTLHAVLQLLGIKAHFKVDRENSYFLIELIH